MRLFKYRKRSIDGSVLSFNAPLYTPTSMLPHIFPVSYFRPDVAHVFPATDRLTPHRSSSSAFIILRTRQHVHRATMAHSWDSVCS